ncbi:MAG: peptidyl-prolyl cis-trans isomerase [bacterium]
MHSAFYYRIAFLSFCVLIVTSGCVSSLRPNSIVIARVNDFPITQADFVEELRQFHLHNRPTAQAKELDIASFLQDMIDRRLIIQEARRMGLDQQEGFQRALSDKNEQMCLAALREEKIVKPSQSLTQKDVDAYFKGQDGRRPPRISEMNWLELQKVRMRKEDALSRAYIEDLKTRSDIEIFDLSDPMSLGTLSGPIARVNGEEIEGQDLYEEIRARMKAGKQSAGKESVRTKEAKEEDAPDEEISTYAEKGLERLIEYWLLRQEAHRKGYGAGKKVREQLKHFEDELLYQTFLQKVLAPKVEIRSEEIDRYYRENSTLLLHETMVYLEEIAEKDPNSAWRDYRELLQGGDFSFMAKHRAAGTFDSQGAGQPEVNRKTGGKWVSLQRMQPELRSLLVAQGLKEGQITPPFKTGSGYSIFRVKEKKGGDKIPLEKVKMHIEKELAAQKLHSLVQDWLRRLRAASTIVIDEKYLQGLTSRHQP